MKHQRGYTLYELFMVVWFIICLALAGVGLYVVWHFISKYW